jgi:hypothetical protein
MPKLLSSWPTSHQNNQYFIGSTSTIFGETFKTPDDGKTHILDSVEFYIKREGNLGLFLPAKAVLWDVDGTPGVDAVPTGDNYNSDTVDISGIINSDFTRVKFTFIGANRRVMQPNTNYFITLEYTGDASNGIYVGTDNGEVYSGNAVLFHPGTLVWEAVMSQAVIFYVYEEGEEPLESIGGGVITFRNETVIKTDKKFIKKINRFEPFRTFQTQKKKYKQKNIKGFK